MVKKSITHTPDHGPIIKIIYIVAIVLWVVGMIYYHHAFAMQYRFLGLIILAIPVFIWATGYYSGHLVSSDELDELFDSNFLAVSLLITIPLLTWLSTRTESQEKFIPLALTAMIFALLSSLDFWTSKEWHNISKHIKSIFATSAIIILIYVIYAFYLVYVKNPGQPFLKT